MYSCIMRDILKGVISTPNRSPNDNEMQFYENSKKHQYTHIEARMLSDRYHPLLSNSNVIDVMNYQKPGVEDVKITYYKNAYKRFLHMQYLDMMILGEVLKFFKTSHSYYRHLFS